MVIWWCSVDSRVTLLSMVVVSNLACSFCDNANQSLMHILEIRGSLMHATKKHREEHCKALGS